VVSLPSSRSPLRFLPPSGSDLPPWSRFPGSSAHDLADDSFARTEARVLAAPAVSSVSTKGLLTRPSPVSSTCSRFPAFRAMFWHFAARPSSSRANTT
jgi:hypothetical protein